MQPKSFNSTTSFPEVLSYEYLNVHIKSNGGSVIYDTSTVDWTNVSRPDLVRAKIQVTTKGVSDYLGPPDLCMYQTGENNQQSQSTSSWMGWAFGDIKKIYPFHFHWILGLDCQNALSIGQYIAQLNDYIRENNSRWYNPFSNDINLTSTSVFIWNSFLQMDLWINVQFPGSLQLYWIKYALLEKEPLKIQISVQPVQMEENQEQFWNQVFTSSILRYFAYVDNLPLQSSATRVLDVRKQLTLETENQILETVKDNLEFLFHSGTYYDYVGESPNMYNNQIIYALLKYLTAQCRHEFGIKYFKQLSKETSELGFLVLVSKLYMDRDEEEEAIIIISNALEEFSSIDLNFNIEEQSLTKEQKSFIHLSLQKCTILSKRLSLPQSILPQELEYAINFLQKLLHICPYHRLARLYYARFLSTSDIQASLLELNKVAWIPAQIPITTNLRVQNQESTLQDLPKWLRIIKQNYYQPISLETAVQTPGIYAKNLPGLYLTRAEKDVYDVLVLYLHQHGWKNLLEARSSVFLMQSDVIKQPKNLKLDSTLESSKMNSTPSTALVLHIEGMSTNKDREEVEKSIQEFDFVLAVTVELNTKIAMIALKIPCSDEITQTLLDTVSKLGLTANPRYSNIQTYTPPDATSNNRLNLKESDKMQFELLSEEKEISETINSQDDKGDIDAQSTSSQENIDNSSNQLHETTLKMEDKDEFVDVAIDDHLEGKVFTEKYIDNLFNIMYKDLCAYSRYQHERKEQFDLYTSLDWVFVGSLLERLGYNDNATHCYKFSSSSAPNTKSLLKLLEVALKPKKIDESVPNGASDSDSEPHRFNRESTTKKQKRSRAEIIQILKLVDQLFVTHSSDDIAPTDSLQIRNQHPYVERALRSLVREIGISQLRENLKHAAVSDISNHIFNEFLFDMIRVHSEGYNR